MNKTIIFAKTAIRIAVDDGRKRLPGAPPLPTRVVEPGSPISLPIADANVLLRYLDGREVAKSENLLGIAEEKPAGNGVRFSTSGIPGVDPRDAAYKWIDEDGMEYRPVFINGEMKAAYGVRQVPR